MMDSICLFITIAVVGMFNHKNICSCSLNRKLVNLYTGNKLSALVVTVLSFIPCKTGSGPRPLWPKEIDGLLVPPGKAYTLPTDCLITG